MAEHIRNRESDWNALSLNWVYREISPNHGEATTGARFEAPGWLGEVSVWVTGETELETVRTKDGSGDNKHYDLVEDAEFDGVLTDLLHLLRDGGVPFNAFSYAVE